MSGIRFYYYVMKVMQRHFARLCGGAAATLGTTYYHLPRNRIYFYREK